MKRFLLLCIMGFLALAAHAQNWAIDGYFNLSLNKTLENRTSKFDIGLNFGRYILERINIGLSIENNFYNYSAGSAPYKDKNQLI